MSEYMANVRHISRRTDYTVVASTPSVLQYITTSGLVGDNTATPVPGANAVNIASVTDGGVGLYTAVFVRSYQNANYAVATLDASADSVTVSPTAVLAGSVALRCANASNTAADCAAGLLIVGR